MEGLKWTMTQLKIPDRLRDSRIFPGDSKFNLIGSNGRRMAWRGATEDLHSDCLVPAIRHEGVTVLAWARISAVGARNLIFIDVTISKEPYKATCLKI